MRCRDGPHVAVLDPTRARHESSVVLAGDDEVVHSRRHGPRDVDPLFGDEPTGDPSATGASIELVDGGCIAGEHQRVQATIGVDLPRVVERVEHVVTGAVLDPSVRYVGA